MNSLTAAELKRRGMAAIEEGLRHGPVHLVKHNKPSAVVVTSEDYARLLPGKNHKQIGVTAIQWLMNLPTGNKRKAQLDKAIRTEREGWR